MLTIWKFSIDTADTQVINVPRDGKILCIQVQQAIGPCLWILVDSEAKLEPRTIEVFGTGHPISRETGVRRVYIGTYQLANEQLVFHVFERLV